MSLKLIAGNWPYPNDIKRHLMQGIKVRVALWVSKYAK